MGITDIPYCRMLNQGLVDSKFKKPEKVVSWFVAMQAQELPMVKWAIALRIPGLGESEIDEAFNSGSILRTHLMRPTWHFVSPDDIRWMIELTAPRVRAANAIYYRKLELDSKVFKKSNDVLSQALQGSKNLERSELQAVLASKKIKVEGIRLAYIMMQAELDAIICSGPRKGNQFTYALLEERAPRARKLDAQEALAELTLRYFTSRAPATVQDFVYWSGLTMKDAKTGVEVNKSNLVKETINGKEYLFGKNSVRSYSADKKKQTAFLLPDYDEYGMSYKDRCALMLNIPAGKSPKAMNGAKTFNHLLMVDGLIVGLWQRDVKNNSILIRTGSFIKLSKAKQKMINDSVKRYGKFFDKKLEQEEIKVSL